MVIFKLVTPFDFSFEGEVFMAVLPGQEGDLGVLQGHIPMMVTLRSGNVTLYKAYHEILKRFKIEKGYAHITHENCTLLVEGAEEIIF